MMSYFQAPYSHKHWRVYYNGICRQLWVNENWLLPKLWDLNSSLARCISLYFNHWILLTTSSVKTSMQMRQNHCLYLFPFDYTVPHTGMPVCNIIIPSSCVKQNLPDPPRVLPHVSVHHPSRVLRLIICLSLQQNKTLVRKFVYTNSYVQQLENIAKISEYRGRLDVSLALICSNMSYRLSEGTHTHITM